MSPYAVPGITRSTVRLISYRGVEFYKQLVSEYFGVNLKDMEGKCRKREYVMARQIAMYLTNKHENVSLKSIGAAFCGRDHTTVIHSRQTVHDLMDTDESFRQHIENLEGKLNSHGTIGKFEEVNH